MFIIGPLCIVNSLLGGWENVQMSGHSFVLDVRNCPQRRMNYLMVNGTGC